MEIRRSVSVLMVLLLTSGSAMGSGRGKGLQVPWSMLGEMIRGKKVVLQLADGETVKGRVRGLTATSLVVRVKKTTDPVAYPKGVAQIPRESVSRIEMRRHSANKRALLSLGAFSGTLFVSSIVLVRSASQQGWGSIPGTFVGILVGLSGAVAAAVYAGSGEARVTLEIPSGAPGKQNEKAVEGGQSRSDTPGSGAVED